MNNNPVNLFVGDPIEEPSERRLIARVRRDLSRRGVPATLIANFFAPGRRQRQIDLLVRTPDRTVHVEIKALDPALPVIAGPNGPWRQIYPDGTERLSGRNYGRQALDGTFSISDSIRDLAERHEVPAAPKGHYRHIDSVVCIWEGIPKGSSIAPPSKVTVVDYAGLIERLSEPGPVLPWDDQHWDALVRHLGVYQPESESEGERRRRASSEAIAEYRFRARATLASGLSTLVDVGAVDEDGLSRTLDDLDSLVGAGRSVMLLGDSGAGKTFYAEHIAVRHCDLGRLVIWARCGEYQQGRLSELLARATGPFSVMRFSDLARCAEDAGVGITLVLDGLDECPENLRAELLQQVAAFALRLPSSIVLTSTVREALPASLDAFLMYMRPPGSVARLEILSLYGAIRPDRISGAFQSPYELAVAASCEAELSERASLGELHDAFIRRHASTEQLRAGLRAIATALHYQLRSVALIMDVAVLLGSSAGLAMAPSEIDQVLRCRLLIVERNRVRFRHELLATFLAAEDLVRRSVSEEALSAALSTPTNERLRDAALAIEADVRRQWRVLVDLADPGYFCAAVTGVYGPRLAEHGLEEMRSLLSDALAATVQSRVEFAPGEGLAARWRCSRHWSAAEQAQLTAVGRLLADGVLVEEIGALADRSDTLCRGAILELQSAGAHDPASLVVAATYSQSSHRDEEALPISFVSVGCELSPLHRFRRRAGGVASQLISLGDADGAWGRLYLAVLLADSSAPEDQTGFAALLRRAWDSGGYHLRLEALWAAQSFGGVTGKCREAIVSVLQSLDTKNWALSSTIVEALAAFGEIESGTTVEDLQGHIRDVIRRPAEPEYWRIASGIVSNQFEEEDIVGPFGEAVGTLQPLEQLRLFSMAARSTEWSMHLSWTVAKLAELVPTGQSDLDAEAQDVFSSFLPAPAGHTFMPTETVAVFLAAIKGWARFHNALPERVEQEDDGEGAAWRLIASVLLQLSRPEEDGESARAWQELMSSCPGNAVDALYWIRSAEKVHPWSSDGKLFPRLTGAFPSEVRDLLEWALTHTDQVRPSFRTDERDRNRFIVAVLGEIGTTATVELLKVFTLDPELGPTAVEAIRSINGRAS